MSTNNSVHWTIDPEYIELLNFLIETTANVKSPMNIRHLAIEFKQTSMTSQSIDYVYSRINSISHYIPWLEGLDDHTKAKMLFALSAPISFKFFKKLKESADVHLDLYYRIIRYKRNGDEFGIIGLHPAKPATNWEHEPEFIELINFIIERTKDVKSHLTAPQLATDFKETVGCFRLTGWIYQKIRYVLLPKIHEIDRLDTDTKVKIMFALSAPIDNDFLELLKNQADVVLDGRRRIIKYRKHGGGLELKEFPSKAEIETQEMMIFLAQKSIELNSPIPDQMFAREYKEKTGDMATVDHLIYRYTTIKRKIYGYDGLDEKVKVRMLFVSGARISVDVLEKLRKNALVEIDEQKRITKYISNDGDLNLERKQNHPAKSITTKIETKLPYSKRISNYFENKEPKNEEMSNLIGFINEKCESVNSPLAFYRLANDFKSRFGITKSFQNVYNKMRGYCREIQKLGYLDTPTIVKQLFALSASLNPRLLEKLRKDALVLVDNKNRITIYAAIDGSLTLQGDHSHSAKVKQAWVERKKKEYSEGVESDSEFDSDIESYFDETEDHVEPEIRQFDLEKKPEILITERGRISKKRYLNVVTSPENYGVSCKRAYISENSNSLTMRPLENYDPDFDDFHIPEVKLESFSGDLIDEDRRVPIEPGDDDINPFSIFKLREPKKEVEEDQDDMEMMEFSVKTEDDFIIPKLEKLEEEPELFY